MYKNDRTRKEILVDFGFRLPSALDNRPLTFEEFEATVHQAIYMSATPGPYELERSQRIVQQLIRPTGIVDPQISVRPTEGQIDDLLEEIRARVERGERALVTTLTKKMAEDLTDYLKELGVKVQYLHSEVDTLERVAILRDLRLGVFDVLVGINLLREGIDLPEVTLVAILDADKEGFLRSAWSLIQMIGRAARNIGGEVIMYADRVTESMRVAIDETDRRRAIQDGLQHSSAASSRRRSSRASATSTSGCARSPNRPSSTPRSGAASSATPTGPRSRRSCRRMEAEMKAAAKQLEFERAAALRDEIQQIRLRVLEQDASITVGGPPSARRGTRGGRGPDRCRRPRARTAGDAAAVAAGRPWRSPASRSCRPTRNRPTTSTAAGEPGIDEGTVADWLPGHPRRARRRGRLAGTLAGPADLGPHGDPEHPEADRPAVGSPPRRSSQRQSRRRPANLGDQV